MTRLAQVLAVPLRRAREALNLPPAPDEVQVVRPPVRKEIQDAKGRAAALGTDMFRSNFDKS